MGVFLCYNTLMENTDKYDHIMSLVYQAIEIESGYDGGGSDLKLETELVVDDIHKAIKSALSIPADYHAEINIP